ncbi:FecR domain-containing protein [Chryseolinea sp. H1M3-3]|uniref:FecR family protein n=1 Tax=Chryseolinea sp. H1M3-3 TaxID=3034144 RepID=UPI0023ECA337|nr:FecR domain-containing protein [Chryseolinea sp. H1M3-3]
MKDYSQFSVKDFIMDEHFQSWVFAMDENTESFWHTWLEENPERRGDVEEARSTLLRLNFYNYDLPANEVSAVWNQIRNTDLQSVDKPRLSKSRLILWYSSVAAAALLIGISSFFWPRTPTMVEYRTAFGETKSITLPDSSTVMLNSNSLLKLHSQWEASAVREVWLDGEAFFSVVHKKNNQPFLVKTSEDVNIEVLGTTFNVYHRDETKIMLNSGQIQLSLPTVQEDEKILMSPGELVEYNEKKYVKRKVDPKLYTAWTEHNLILNRTSLREMLHMIKNNYGIEVDVKESLLEQTISGSMPVTDAESLLQQIAKAFQLKVIKEENRIYLKE